MTFALKFLYSQFFVRPEEPTGDFRGQVIIVTGANTGLGLEAARILVRLGAKKVILGVRTLEKGDAAAKDILESVPGTKSIVKAWPLDLTDTDSIRTFAELSMGLERLDAVIQNAGAYTTKFERLRSGDEIHLGVNVIGPALLGLMLLPKLRQTAKRVGAPSRMTFVGSDEHYIAPRQLLVTQGSIMEALNREETIPMCHRYAVSELLLFYTAREIAARCPVDGKSDVIISCLTPGFCKSEIYRDQVPWPQAVGQWLAMNVVARSTETGAYTLVDGVKPELGLDAHGRFLMDCNIASNGDNLESDQGRELREKFTTELFARLDKIVPGIKTNMK